MRACFALALMSIIWIVPFLMFCDVTTIVAVADVAETSNATIAVVIAAFTISPSLGSSVVAVVFNDQ